MPIPVVYLSYLDIVNTTIPVINVYASVGTGIVESVYVYTPVFDIKILDIYALPVLIEEIGKNELKALKEKIDKV
jgi:hypothetical protein